jgi:hypothetical protein
MGRRTSVKARLLGATQTRQSAKTERAPDKSSALADFELQTMNYKKERVTNKAKDVAAPDPFKS